MRKRRIQSRSRSALAGNSQPAVVAGNAWRPAATGLLIPKISPAVERVRTVERGDFRMMVACAARLGTIPRDLKLLPGGLALGPAEAALDAINRFLKPVDDPIPGVNFTVEIHSGSSNDVEDSDASEFFIAVCANANCDVLDRMKLSSGIFSSLSPGLQARVLLAVVNALNLFCGSYSPIDALTEAEYLWWGGWGSEGDRLGYLESEAKEDGCSVDELIRRRGIVSPDDFNTLIPPHLTNPKPEHDPSELLRHGFSTQLCDLEIATDRILQAGRLKICDQLSGSRSILGTPVVIRWSGNDMMDHLIDEREQLDIQTCSRMDVCGFWFAGQTDISLAECLREIPQRAEIAGAAYRLLEQVTDER